MQEWVEGLERRLEVHLKFIKENAMAANALREEREVLKLLQSVRKESGALSFLPLFSLSLSLSLSRSIDLSISFSLPPLHCRFCLCVELCLALG